MKRFVLWKHYLVAANDFDGGSEVRRRHEQIVARWKLELYDWASPILFSFVLWKDKFGVQPTIRFCIFWIWNFSWLKNVVLVSAVYLEGDSGWQQNLVICPRCFDFKLELFTHGSGDEVEEGVGLNTCALKFRWVCPSGTRSLDHFMFQDNTPRSCWSWSRDRKRIARVVTDEEVVSFVLSEDVAAIKVNWLWIAANSEIIWPQNISGVQAPLIISSNRRNFNIKDVPLMEGSIRRHSNPCSLQSRVYRQAWHRRERAWQGTYLPFVDWAPNHLRVLVFWQQKAFVVRTQMWPKLRIFWRCHLGDGVVVVTVCRVSDCVGQPRHSVGVGSVHLEAPDQGVLGCHEVKPHACCSVSKTLSKLLCANPSSASCVVIDDRHGLCHAPVKKAALRIVEKVVKREPRSNVCLLCSLEQGMISHDWLHNRRVTSSPCGIWTKESKRSS